jgi:hypothetical protein
MKRLLSFQNQNEITKHVVSDVTPAYEMASGAAVFPV